jgi:hypothetical protein
MAINLRLSSSPNGTRNVFALIRDLVGNYSADATGSTSITSALNSFSAEAVPVTGRVKLTIPAGTFTLSSSTGGVQTFTAGIENLLISGAGRDVTSITRTSSGPQLILGAQGLFQDNLHHALVNTVSAGANSVTLIDITKISRFSVGQYCLMAGNDLQGYGDPFNNHFFEYVKIADITGAVITFDRTLRYSYKSTWPVYNDGSNYLTGGGMTQGGAATLYALKPVFDTDTIVEGINFIAGSGTIDSVAQFAGRNVEIKDCRFNGQYAMYPTVAETATFTNPDSDGKVEFDKSITTVNIVGGYIEQLWFQSSSLDTANISNNHTTDFCDGTPKNLVVNNSTLTRLKLGPTGYGCTESVEVNNSTLGSLEIGGLTPVSISGQSYTMSGGVIQVPVTSDLPTWAAIGGWIRFIASGGHTIGFAQVLDLSMDASYTYVTTNLAGGFPSGSATITVHPCPIWSGLNNVGCPEAIEHSMAYAQNKPAFSYVNRTYDKTLLPSGAAVKPTFWGLLTATDAMSVDVQAAYVGALSLTWMPTQFTNQFRVWRSGAVVNLNMVINAKIAAKRTYNGATQTWSNAQSGDTLPTFQAGDWMLGTLTSTPSLSRDVSAESNGPTIVWEIKTDQGIS